MKTNEITEQEIQTYVKEVEAGKRGVFSYRGHGDIFHELIARRKRMEEGIGVELFPRIWPVMCEHFGGLRSEDLTVITGDTGKGKTTFSLRYMLSLLQQGYPGLILSLEEGFSNLSKRIGEMVLESREKTWDDTKVGMYKTLTEQSAPIHVFSPSGPLAEDRAIDAMKYAVFKFGIRFVVIDNLTYIRLNYRHGGSDASSIGSFLTRLTGFAENHLVPVILIAHPSKLGDKGFKERETGMDELKGSSDIKQLAHTILSIFPWKDKTIVRFPKIRCSDYAHNRGKCMIFDYDDKRSWLTEACDFPQKIKGDTND